MHRVFRRKVTYTHAGTRVRARLCWKEGPHLLRSFSSGCLPSDGISPLTSQALPIARYRSESAASVLPDFSRCRSPFVGGAARLSYLPMMDDSSEKAVRVATESPTRDDERISHSTCAPHFSNSADSDYDRFPRRSASPMFFFSSLGPGTKHREHPAFSRLKSDPWHFSHDRTASRLAAGQLRRGLSKNRRQCPIAARFFSFSKTAIAATKLRLSGKARSIAIEGKEICYCKLVKDLETS